MLSHGALLAATFGRFFVALSFDYSISLLTTDIDLNVASTPCAFAYSMNNHNVDIVSWNVRGLKTRGPGAWRCTRC
jgi:hypothetical protein